MNERASSGVVALACPSLLCPALRCSPVPQAKVPMCPAVEDGRLLYFCRVPDPSEVFQTRRGGAVDPHTRLPGYTSSMMLGVTQVRDQRAEGLQGHLDLWATSNVAPTCLDAWAGVMWAVAGVSARFARLSAGSNTCDFFFRGRAACCCCGWCLPPRSLGLRTRDRPTS